MGAIYRFDVLKLKNQNNLKTYIETGTGEGSCLRYATSVPFENFHSVEIYPEIYEKAKLSFLQDNIHLTLGKSVDFLDNLFKGNVQNSFIFLDAHFPGADFHYTSYENCGKLEDKLPLEKEMEIILKYRKDFNDVILIDDLRIYMDGPFEGGNWALRSTVGTNKCGFIFDILNKMDKQIYIDYRDQGYVLAV